MSTPLMRQYNSIKQKYPDTLLLFQVGDFYEFFFNDAQVAASVLGIALTQRGTTAQGEPIPLCGVPVHVLDTYLAKLVKAGFKVAVCDQLDKAQAGKTIDRGVTQVLTPGTLTDSKLLNDKTASYLAVFFPTVEHWALVFAELLTGQVFITQLQAEQVPALEAELSRFLPDEIVLADTKLTKKYKAHLEALGYTLTYEQVELARQELQEQTATWFSEQFNQVYNEQPEAVRTACAVLYYYIKRTNERALSQLKQLSIYQPDDYLMLDAATQRNLELVKNTHDGTSTHTLFWVLDEAVTSMGSRMIKKWLLRPLIKQELIEQRLDAVEYFLQNQAARQNLRALLRSVGDLERTVGRIGLRRAQFHDYTLLLRALELVPELIKTFESCSTIVLLEAIKAKCTDFGILTGYLRSALNDDTSHEWLIKPGFNQELDRLRNLLEHGAQALIQLERKEQERTGINSLKIRYNGAHGYGIEISKAQAHTVPDGYTRIQTLAHRERFTTQELKDLEYDLTRARTDTQDVEKELFNTVKQQVELSLNQLKKYAYALAYLDALLSLAEVAYKHSYTRPVLTALDAPIIPGKNSVRELTIADGRHPVIAAQLRDAFIANSALFNAEQQLLLITGPNMGGKSTYLRQVALIIILAQMGSFVPAAQARFSLVDRIFTRLGAADNVSQGKSTFLVEMEETALICTQATARSLVILDEVGRGTSTFDGLAIAQAVVEYIYTQVQAWCLFATHYHELTRLSEQHTGIVLYYAASTKAPDGSIVLLHKIIPGIADGSFGLEVAKRAQLPEIILQRAHALAEQLRISGEQRAALLAHTEHRQEREQQKREDALRQELAQIDCDQLTAQQALDLIGRLKQLC